MLLPPAITLQLWEMPPALMKEQEKQKHPFLSHATAPRGLQAVEVLH